jgi:hypothetical protein
MALPQQCRGNKMMNKKDGNKTRRKDLKMNFQEENPEEENNTFKLPVLRHFQIAGDRKELPR